MRLESSEVSSNYAHYAGGGLYLSDDATVSFEGSKKSVIRNNTAGTTGGGIRLASALDHAALTQFLVVDGNTAHNQSSDISNSAHAIQVVRSNADSLIASDTREGFLQLTLNVSGRNGMPSADDLTYSLYDANHAKLFDQNVVTQGTGLRMAAISLKRPPGASFMGCASCRSCKKQMFHHLSSVNRLDLQHTCVSHKLYSTSLLLTWRTPPAPATSYA
jgi:hypothetical protein